MLAPYDAIIVDDGVFPFTVESYLTRTHARVARKQALEIQSTEETTDTTEEKSSHSMERVPSSQGRRFEDELMTRSFPDFVHLYHDKNFVRLAETTEKILDLANAQMSALRKHLRTEGGMSVIRVRDRRTDQLVPKRCILLPSTALERWRGRLNQITTDRLDACFSEFSSSYMEKFRDYNEMESLFYLKRIGIGTPDRENFKDVPLWKMEVMLKKWRTDRALQQWIDNYEYK